MNKNYRDRLHWRAVIITITFVPALAVILALTWFVLWQEGLSFLLSLLFVGFAFCVGYGMASFKNDNADAILSRAGDKELEHWKVLIDMELQYRNGDTGSYSLESISRRGK